MALTNSEIALLQRQGAEGGQGCTVIDTHINIERSVRKGGRGELGNSIFN